DDLGLLREAGRTGEAVDGTAGYVDVALDGPVQEAGDVPHGGGCGGPGVDGDVPPSSFEDLFFEGLEAALDGAVAAHLLDPLGRLVTAPVEDRHLPSAG